MPIPLDRDYAAPTPALHNTPEYALCVAILVRALEDLRAQDPQTQGDAASWCTTEACTWLCDALGVPPAAVQARARGILAQPDAVRPLHLVVAAQAPPKTQRARQAQARRRHRHGP